MPSVVFQKIFRSVEVPMFLLFFALMLVECVFPNMIIYRTCYITLGYDEHNCSLLGTGSNSSAIKDLEAKVQPHTTVILMTRTVLEAVIPSLLSLFLGPWSDKNGRKPLIISSLFGFLLTFIIFAVLASFTELSPWWFVLATLVSSCCGGLCTFITVIFCYISDCAPIDKRAFRMVTLEVSLAIGLFVGVMSGAPLFKLAGYTTVYALSSLTVVLALLYTYFLIEESLQQPCTENSRIFDCQYIVDIFSTCFRKRDNAARAILWTVIAAMGFAILCYFGNANVNYFFVRKKLNWSLEHFADYNAVLAVVSIVGTLVSIYVFQNIFKMSEAFIAMVSLFANIVANIVKAIAFKDWHLYSVIPILFFGNLTNAMCRSIVSKTIPPQDLGKIFSMTSSIESLTPLIAAPLYTFLYNNTLKSFPGAFYLISAIFTTVSFFLMGIAKYIQKKHPEILPEPLIDECGSINEE